MSDVLEKIKVSDISKSKKFCFKKSASRFKTSSEIVNSVEQSTRELIVSPYFKNYQNASAEAKNGAKDSLCDNGNSEYTCVSAENLNGAHKKGNITKIVSKSSSKETFDFNSSSSKIINNCVQNPKKEQSKSPEESIVDCSKHKISEFEDKYVDLTLLDSPIKEIGGKNSVLHKLNENSEILNRTLGKRESLSISPNYKTKKFTFKKKSDSSLGLFECNSVPSTSSLSPQKDDSTVKIIDSNSEIVCFNGEFNNDFMDDDEFEKFLTQSSCSTQKASEIKQNNSRSELDNQIDDFYNNFAEDDFMTDEEFERRFGSNFETKINTNNRKFDKDLIKVETPKTDDDFLQEISDINWDEDKFAVETNLSASHLNSSNLNISDLDSTCQGGFKNRQDNSKEFQKFFPHSDVMIEVLTQKFGLRTFRPHQREIINASLMQHDCFVLMPTGGGKSLCYQLPAILMPGVTIVISPLRALISDQVDKLNSLDIPSAHLCSDVSKSDTELILSKLYVKEPVIKLLYLTPEKIVASGVVNSLLQSLYQRGKLARIVIDEAHCLSCWGHDFRPDYKQLGTLRKQFPTVPIICLTATATQQVETDVINILSLKNVKRFIRSFNRPNIKYQVLPKTGKSVVNEIANLIKSKFHRRSGIIYCLCRADCDNLAKDLSKMGVKARAYHAGMSDKIRERVQREWMQDQFHVIVATIAFGMGIDKPDVRFVIHNSIPKSVEAFYQESGRAGRDGEISYSYLFYSYADVGRLQRLIRLDRSMSNTFDGHFENLKQMVAFAENVVDCRRHLQLIHLGENFDRKICMQNKSTICDNCENFHKYKTIDVTNEAKHLAQIVRDLSSRENVTLLHVADIYKGAKIKKILDKNHDNHKFYGMGAKMDKVEIQRILKNLILKNILVDFCTFTGDFPVVYIKPGPKITSLNNPKLKVLLSVSTNRKLHIDTPSTSSSKSELDIFDDNKSNSLKSGNLGPNINPNKIQRANKLVISQLKVTCHEELLEQCRQLAVEKDVTLSTIMNLSAIKTMSEVLPKTKEEMLKIQHVTVANYAKVGEHFLAITKKFREKIDKLQEEQQTQILNISRQSNQSSINNTMNDNDVFRDEDWNKASGSSQGVKRKSGGGWKKGGAKRYKKSRRKGGSKKQSPKKNGKKKKTGGKSKGGGGIGLMPLHIT